MNLSIAAHRHAPAGTAEVQQVHVVAAGAQLLLVEAASLRSPAHSSRQPSHSDAVAQPSRCPARALGLHARDAGKEKILLGAPPATALPGRRSSSDVSSLTSPWVCSSSPVFLLRPRRKRAHRLPASARRAATDPGEPCNDLPDSSSRSLPGMGMEPDGGAEDAGGAWRGSGERQMRGLRPTP